MGGGATGGGLECRGRVAERSAGGGAGGAGGGARRRQAQGPGTGRPPGAARGPRALARSTVPRGQAGRRGPRARGGRGRH
uniref:Uncharacterized protein n=1 Tax=Setaria viridis TaxID=4556 RepID=A0A4V6DCG5_SETVI|nr:hypothetical protein SEVIR_1G064900v2 [Setaria viridis]